jgi:hypothetical protein
MWLQPQSCVLFNLGEPMYKITIDLSTWGTEDEVLTIETFDFDKIEIIKEFIEFQQDHGWAVDYDVVTEEDEEDEDEAEDEEYEDEDGDYFYDVENDAWYQYDKENDEWNEVDAEEDESEDEVEATGDTYIFNITTVEDKEEK